MECVWSCGSNTYSATYDESGDTITSEARFLILVDYGDWTAAEIRVPWADSIPIGKYAILHPGVADISVPQGFTIIQAPLTNSIVFSSVYTSAIDELGKLDAVKAVADGSFYVPGDTVRTLIESGRIIDIGSSMAPLVEKAIDAEPDGVLLSPYSGGSNTGLERLGIPMVWMADYLETTPLGRAEWLLLIGELYGNSDEAKRIYRDTASRYNLIKDKVSADSIRPVVIAEKPMTGVWYVPGGQSYLAKMYVDAGAQYPWSYTKNSGSISLDEATVIDKGEKADFWLIKDIKPYTTESLLKELPRAGALSPFPKSIYYCNTLKVPYYNVIAFHPDRVLHDMAVIFHPDIFPAEKLEFYEHLQ